MKSITSFLWQELLIVCFLIPNFSCNDKNTGQKAASMDTTVSNSSDISQKDTIAENKLNGLNIDASKPAPLPVEINGEIIFDADFKPTVLAQVVNNLKDDIIAFELIIDPNRYSEGKHWGPDCKKIVWKEKAKIPAGKSFKLKRKLDYDSESECKIEFARIYLGDFIMSNGQKKNLAILFFESASK